MQCCIPASTTYLAGRICTWCTHSNTLVQMHAASNTIHAQVYLYTMTVHDVIYYDAYVQSCVHMCDVMYMYNYALCVRNAQLATKTRSCTSRENKMADSCASSFDVKRLLYKKTRFISMVCSPEAIRKSLADLLLYGKIKPHTHAHAHTCTLLLFFFFTPCPLRTLGRI